MTYQHLYTPNYDARGGSSYEVSILVLHYTGMKTARAALGRMCDPNAKVSAHWCIDEEGTIYKLVSEKMRAWHAGISCWREQTLINDISLGIELVNPGHAFGYRPFPSVQINALIKLMRDILTRYDIPKRNIVGHSDIAPNRKNDPGELFEWKRLAAEGIGLWPNKILVAQPDLETLVKGSSGIKVLELQKKFLRFGYGLKVDGLYNKETEFIVKAFQRHFRQSSVNGTADTLTQVTLENLLEQVS